MDPDPGVMSSASPAKRQRTEASSAPPEVELYSYWRSSCSWRVRISLAWKGLDFEYRAVHLVKGEQKSDEYARLNKMQVRRWVQRRVVCHPRSAC